MSDEKFTVEEIRVYILSQDSMGDILYNLNAKKIKEVNKKKEFDGDESGQKNITAELSCLRN